MVRETWCDKCDICINNQYTPHWGEGSQYADIMFIGESPSRKEKREDTVYTGKKYDIIKKLLWLHNFDETNGYYTHLIKCTTPKGRMPSKTEVNHCLTHLLEELSIKPKIIVTFGQTVLQYLLSDMSLSIYKEHGKPRIIGKFVVIPTFSASFLNMNPDKIIWALQDFQFITKVYTVINPTHFKQY